MAGLDNFLEGLRAPDAPEAPTPPQTAPEASGLDSYLKGISVQDQATSDLQRSVSFGITQNPEQISKATKLSASTGFDPLTIAADPMVHSEATRRDTLGKINLDSVLQTHPHTARALSKPLTAALSHDDVAGMQKVETAMRDYQGAAESGRSTASDLYEIGRQIAAGVYVGIPQMVAGGLRFYGLAAEVDPYKGAREIDLSGLPQRPEPGVLIPSNTRIPGAEPAPRIKTPRIEWSPSAVGESAELYWQEKAKGWEPDVAGRGHIASVMVEGARQIGPSAMGMATAVVNPYMGINLIAAIYGGQQGHETYQKGIKAGLAPSEALRAAKINWAIEGYGEGLADAAGGAILSGGSKVLKAMTMTGGKVTAEAAVKVATSPRWAAELAKDWTANAILQSATEFAQNYGEASVEKAFGIDDADPTERGIHGAEVALAMSLLMGVGVAPMHVISAQRRAKVGAMLLDITAPTDLRIQAARVVADDISEQIGPEKANAWLNQMATNIANGEAQQVQRASEVHDALTSLSQAATAAKLRERDTGQFNEFMQSMIEDMELKDLYISADKMHELLAQAPIEIQQQLMQSLPTVAKQLSEAKVSSGDIRIPITEYATHVAGTELDAALLPHMKADAAGLTYSEAQEQVKEQQDLMVSEAEGLTTKYAEDQEYQADSQKVYDTLLQRVEGAKRFSPDVNKKYATLQHAWFVTRAERRGVKPSELLALFNVQVTPEKTLGAQLDQGATLRGLPTSVNVDGKQVNFGAFQPARDAAQSYATKAGLVYTPPTDYVKVDPERARRIAAAYEAMPHEPNNPEVKAAYDALVKETVAQWKEIAKTGLKVEFFPEGKDTYGNPRNAVLDIVNNNHLFIFPTEAGYGMDAAVTKDNPMLAPVKGVKFGGKPVLVNDLFRAVHDYFGHAKEGIGFRAEGEENAWRVHSAMFSPLAQRALTTETRGQNSWLNSGPHAEFNKTASGADTIYAEQKIGLLPEWVSQEGAGTTAQPSSDYGYRARNKARKATLDSFNPANVGNLLRMTDWAILTAENPNAEAMSPEENAIRNTELKADLDAMGVEYVEVNGKYGGNEEHSFAVVGITRDQATELGTKYGQQSVLTRDGFVYADGSVNPAKSVSSFAKTPEDFYSVVPSTGAAFAVDIDFNKQVSPTGEDRVGELQIEAVHFSRAPRDELSGFAYGTGVRGAEGERLADPVADPRIKQRIAFYVDEGQGVRPEAGVGPFRHELTLTNMYDGATNPLKFPADSNAFEKAVVDAGFDGYYVKEGFGKQGVAVMLGDAAASVQVDTPPKGDEYNQAALNEIYDSSAPEGKLTPQDLADLRKLWTLYAANEDMTNQYGRAHTPAKDLSQSSIFQNLEQTFNDVFYVMPELTPEVQDITRFREGMHPQVPADTYAFRIASGPRMAELYINPIDKSMQLNILNWGEGGGGAAVYKAVLEFARNNGFVFYGDTQGISVAAIKRRLENLLSHAIQTGETQHMQLHPKQLAFIEQETGTPLVWKVGDNKNNIEQMLNASYNLSNLDIPELKNVYYDFTQNAFVDASTGGAIADLAGYVAKARRNIDKVRREGAAGDTTAKRTSFSNTLLRAKTPEARRLVFDSVARLSLEQLSGPGRLLYQSAAVGEQPAFYSALTRAIEASQQKKGTPDQWIGILKNLTQKGIKPEELEWTGVLDRLEVMKASKVASVTKEELVSYLNANAVVVEPVVLGEDGAFSEFDFSFGEFETEEADEGYLYERAEETVSDWSIADMEERLPEEDEAVLREIEGLTRLSYSEQRAWKEQKGEAQRVYSELVDTQVEQEREWYYSDEDAPQSRNIVVMAGDRGFSFTHYYSYGDHYVRDDEGGREVSDLGRRPDDASIESAIRSYLMERYDVFEGGEGEAKFESYTLPDGADYQERLLVNKTTGEDPFSYTSHFDEDNIIAFSRTDTRGVPVASIEAEFPEVAARLKAEGRGTAKVYFLEEVQSDWAQQGRERPDVDVPYTREDLVVDEVASAGDAERLEKLEVRDYEDAGGRTLYAVFDKADSSRVSSAYGLRENAEEQRLRLAGSHEWIIRAPDQVFTISRTNKPTSEEAIQYVLASKSHREKSALSAFAAYREKRRLDKEIDKLHSERIVLIEGMSVEERNKAVGGPAIDAIEDRILDLKAQKRALPRAVPSGPFVESTDAWVSLVMKDAIRQAAAGGFDLVSWTTGDQQTKRWTYGLRKEVDTIHWAKKDGKVHVIASKNTSERANAHYSETDLAAAIGKTMANQILSDEKTSGTITDTGIVVADLGMVKFYGDTEGNNPDGKPAIVTKVANQVLKKLGGGKVKTFAHHGEYGVKEVGSRWYVTTPDGFFGESFLTEAQAKNKAAERTREAGGLSPARDDKFSAQPAFEITDKMREIAMQGQPLFQPNRGTFNPDTLTISLLKDADLTTFLHESGHFFLEAEAALASDPATPQEMKDDFTKILNWLGIKDLATWNGMTLEQKRVYHEKYARGFEAYLFEGKAPSAELTSVFASFKAWLLHVYRNLTNLNVELTDEVRGVFDRMLASDAQIEATEKRQGMVEAHIETLTEAEQVAYAALGGAATDDAKRDMERRSLRDMQWLSNAKSRELKRLQKEAAGKRKEVRAEATEEVMSEPLNKARTFLRKGEMVDEATGDAVKADKGFRLDTAALAEMYPETMLARPDLDGLRGMTSKEGLHPDLVADMFGFRSGDALVRELITGESAKEKIEGIADQRMLERYGDLYDANAIERAANEAVHNEARARFMATGLKALTDNPLPVSQIVTAAKQAADLIVAAKKVRDVKPNQYIAAETRANKEVLKNAAKDVEKAKKAQRAALLNNRLTRAAEDALEEVRKGVDRMNRTQKVAAQSNMRGDYLIQLNALLGRFDLRKSTTLKEIDAKRIPLQDWLAAESERLSAVMPDLPAWILNEGNQMHYKELTVEQFRGLVDAVKQLEMMARREEKQYQAIRNMKFSEERQAILDRIREFHPDAFAVDGDPKSMSKKFVKHLGDKVEELGDKFAGEFLNAETIINLLEGGNYGVVQEALFNRMSNRANWKATRSEEIFAKVQPLFSQYSLKERYDFGRRDIGAPIGMSLTRENALVVALLNGNKEGRERLANYGWSQDVQDKIIGLLDERDMLVANSIWDLFDNDLWPELKALNERTRGKAPPKVEAVAVVHQGKTYRGGYFRLKYDTDLDEQAHRYDETQAVKDMLGGSLGMSAKTGQGASTERKENVTKRPRLDLGVFSEAVSETIHDLAYREAVADTMRMLNDVKIQNTIKTVSGIPAYRALVTRVREIAAPPRNPSGFIEKTLTIARKNTIVTLMSGVKTALQNFTGFVSASARVNPGGLAKEIALFYSPKMMKRYEFAMSQSEYMRHRYTSFERDLQNEVKKLTVNASVMPEMSTFLALMAVVDRGVSVPVWNTAFKDGMAKFTNDTQKSVEYADHIVRQTQGSGRELDVAKIMSGHGGYGQLKRVFTMFYSYFNAQLGMLVRSGAINAKLAKTNPALAVAGFTKDFMLVFVIPAVMTNMIFKGGGDDEPEDWLHSNLHALAMYGMAMFPLVRDIGSFAWSAFDHDVKNYGFKVTPIQSAGEGVVRGAVAVKDIVSGEGDDKDLKNLIMGTSFAVGLPGKLISDTTMGTKAWLEGEAGPEAVVLGPPKK